MYLKHENNNWPSRNLEENNPLTIANNVDVYLHEAQNSLLLLLVKGNGEELPHTNL